MNLRIGTTEQNSQHYYKKFYLEKNKGKNLIFLFNTQRKSLQQIIDFCVRKKNYTPFFSKTPIH